jgi:hypothetical protein
MNNTNYNEKICVESFKDIQINKIDYLQILIITYGLD